MEDELPGLEMVERLRAQYRAADEVSTSKLLESVTWGSVSIVTSLISAGYATYLGIKGDASRNERTALGVMAAASIITAYRARRDYQLSTQAMERGFELTDKIYEMQAH